MSTTSAPSNHGSSDCVQQSGNHPHLTENSAASGSNQQFKMRKHKYHSAKKIILSQEIGFFELPREVRDIIYFYILRPDCRMNEFIHDADQCYYRRCFKLHKCISSGLGRTKVLVLNRQAYQEAIGFLNVFENLITIRGKGHRVFRDPLAFGKSGGFACNRWISQCYLGPKFTELQVLCCKHLAHEVHYAVPSNDDEKSYAQRLGMRRKEVKEAIGVLRKSTGLETLRLILQTQDVEIRRDTLMNDYTWHPITVYHHTDMHKLLQLFINAAQSCGFPATAEEQKHFAIRRTDNHPKMARKIDAYFDPVAAWFNSAAQARSIDARLDDKYDDKILSWRYLQEEKTRHESWWSQCLCTSTALRHECDFEVLDHNGMTRQEGIWVSCSGSQRYIHDDPDRE